MIFVNRIKVWDKKSLLFIYLQTKHHFTASKCVIIIAKINYINQKNMIKSYFFYLVPSYFNAFNFKIQHSNKFWF